MDIQTARAEVSKGRIVYEYRLWPYAILMWLINLFALWIGWRKKRAGEVRITQYSRWFDGLAPLRRIREGAARWPSLDVIYNWSGPDCGGLGGWFENLWLNLRNCQAVRNRYRLVVALLREEIERRGGQARILTIASGSAQPVFEAAAGFPEVEIVCIDSDATALAYSQQLAEKYGVKNIRWCQGNILSPSTTAGNYTPDIVEVVGLFDYLSETAITGLLRRIRKMAVTDATLLTAHIHPNPEMQFLQNVVDWDMRYRTLEQLKELMGKGGLDQRCEYHTEPHGIHTVVRGFMG